ncbi:GH25 family lysozyme [Shewanella surugensis]|uniref:Lysozyme n=1 Tax=Shewanella surugensis TaxID=212020 RepID=A0ABT0LCR7_9GAMM|nr:GH25 family lysozyme [Shewanella surugensis]MCL1124971.1 hypothetical protein [Shewanella surugensis]
MFKINQSKKTKIRVMLILGLILVWYIADLYVKPLLSDNYSIQGIDVSHYQGRIDWPQVNRQLFPFAIAKATGGETYVDPEFHINWHGMRENGLIRGAYHFFYAADDPQKQALKYLSVVGEWNPADLPPILDIEITDNMNGVAIRERSLVWLNIVEKETQRRPIIYTNSFFSKTYLNDPRLARFPLWIAQYSAELSVLPEPWKDKGTCRNTWCLWQHSQNGKVTGVNAPVDLNHFNGNLPSLKKFIRDSHQ